MLAVQASCPGQPSSGGYIDPSGTIQDTHGNPVSGATVTVLHSDTAAGPFVAVPSGSAEIEPSTNPETSDSQGQFAWEVLAGYYQIQTTKSGCTSPGDSSQAIVSTDILQVPPPQDGLQLTLDCGPSSSAVPTVSSIIPALGPHGRWHTVTLTGSGFSGATAVQFGAAGPASFTVESPTTVLATSPAYGTAGPVTVTITTPGGTPEPDRSPTWHHHPYRHSLSRTDRPEEERLCTIIGNFGFVSAVTFGSAAANFVQASPTELFVETPPGSGSVQITLTSVCPSGMVTTICGVNAVSGLSGFTYGAFGLQITSVSPLHPGLVKTLYSDTLAASGGNPPYKWSVSSGKLPKGLHLKKSTGVISGTPNKNDSGMYTFTLKVVDTKTKKTKGHPSTQNTATKVLSIAIS